MAVRALFGRRLAVAATLTLSLMLAACGQKSAPAAGDSTAGSAPAPAVAVTAADPAVQKIYDTTCKSCHGVPASGAPQAGDAKAWGPRIAQGKDVLIDHATNGFKGMPPMGMCPQCSEKDLVSLIEMMSGASLK
jgi:cytochrome c5